MATDLSKAIQDAAKAQGKPVKKPTTKKTGDLTQSIQKAAKTQKKSATKKPTTKKKAVSAKLAPSEETSNNILEPQVSAEKLEYPFVCNFEKVSNYTFKNSIIKLLNAEEVSEATESAIEAAYNDIKLPTRLSPGTSEYHFLFPLPELIIQPGVTVAIPTGIKCFLARNWNLEIIAEDYTATLGSDIGASLIPPVQIVNPDDYGTDIEGQIYITFSNTNKDTPITITKDAAFAKGILRMFGLAYNEKMKEA